MIRVRINRRGSIPIRSRSPIPEDLLRRNGHSKTCVRSFTWLPRNSQQPNLCALWPSGRPWERESSRCERPTEVPASQSNLSPRTSRLGLSKIWRPGLMRAADPWWC